MRFYGPLVGKALSADGVDGDYYAIIPSGSEPLDPEECNTLSVILGCLFGKEKRTVLTPPATGKSNVCEELPKKKVFRGSFSVN